MNCHVSSYSNVSPNISISNCKAMKAECLPQPVKKSISEEVSAPKKRSLCLCLRSLYSENFRKSTKFTRRELYAVIQIFWTLSNGTMVITEAKLKTFLTTTFGIKEVRTRMRGYERLRSKNVRVGEFIKILGVILYGSHQDKAAFLYEIYDEKESGVVEKGTFLSYLYTSFEEKQRLYYLYEDIPEKLMSEFIMGKMGVRIFDDHITRDQFVQAMATNPLFMEFFFPIHPEEKYIRLFKKLLMEKPITTLHLKS